MFAFMLSFISCSRGQQPDMIIQPVLKVDSVGVKQLSSDEGVFRLIASVPDPCYTFSHVAYDVKRDSLICSVYVKRPKNVNCIQVIGKLEMDIEVDFGKYQISIIDFRGRLNHKAMILKPERKTNDQQD